MLVFTLIKNLSDLDIVKKTSKLKLSSFETELLTDTSEKN